MRKELEVWTQYFSTRPKCRAAGNYLTISADKKKKTFVMAIATETQTYILSHEDFANNDYKDRDSLAEVFTLFIDTCYAPDKEAYPPFAFLDRLLELLPNDTDLQEILRCP